MGAPYPPCGTPDGFFTYRLSQSPTKSGKDRARNRHAGPCDACGRYLMAGQGCVSKTQGRWVIYC